MPYLIVLGALAYLMARCQSYKTFFSFVTDGTNKLAHLSMASYFRTSSDICYLGQALNHGICHNKVDHLSRI